MIAVEHLKVGSREIAVFLPSGYADEPERRYPVVYVQDAGKLLELSFNEIEHFTTQGFIQQAIYVGVKPHDRNNEYTPWPAKALFPGQADNGGTARAYIDELADVCKPYLDRHYRTLSSPTCTVIIGGSFGGLVSLLAGLWRSDVFGKLGLLSASFWYENLLGYLQKQPAPAVDRIYMSVGDCEGIYKQSRQSEMVAATLAMRDIWRCRGLDEQHLRFVLDRGGTHDAHYMGGNFPKAMQWLLPGPSVDSE